MLTMRGISRAVSLDVDHAGTMTDPWGNTKLGFSAVGVLQRKALDKGGVLVGDLVKLELHIQVALQAAPVPVLVDCMNYSAGRRTLSRSVPTRPYPETQ